MLRRQGRIRLDLFRSLRNNNAGSTPEGRIAWEIRWRTSLPSRGSASSGNIIATPRRNWKNGTRRRKAQWTNLTDLRIAYPKADQVGRCLIFNVCGNKYRLIVRVTQNWKRLYVRHVLTHKDYDKQAWLIGCSD